MTKYHIFTLTILICACSNSQSGKKAQEAFIYGTPDASSIKEMDTLAKKDSFVEKSDTFAPEKDIFSQDAQEIAQNDTNVADILSVDAQSAKDVAQKDSGPSKPPCIDDDNDGFGINCAKGVDCDDKNPNFAVICPDCTNKNYAGCLCTGVAANCYSGQAQWLGKGQCQSGVQLCKKGFWSECKGESLPTPEICDGMDNNCNGLIDEGVLSACGTCDLSCTLQKIGPDFGNPFDISGKKGLKINKNGYIELDIGKSSVDLSNIWIANSSEQTVSKLNTKTGKEVGRYKVCGSPSRTSVDLEGDVWVGCRSDGGVVKIINDKKHCIDKNGNGVIDTATDTNNNGKIDSNEIKPYQTDECLKFVVYPDGKTVARAAGVDKDNHAWMGFWNSKRLRRLHPFTGASTDVINLGCNPYGLVIDQKGIIWVSGRGCSSLVRVDPKTKSVKSVGNGKGSPYGINVDMFGKIWIANTNSYTSRYDPVTGVWNSILHNQRSRGVATSNDGHVYVALDTTSTVAKINVVTLTVVAHIALGNGRYPVGIAVDYDGYVWAVNQSKATTSKIDVNINKVVGEYPVGKGPYTYSDMTGYTLHNYTAPKGDFSHTFGYSGWSGTVAESKITTKWEKVMVDVTLPPKSFIEVRYKASNTLKLLDKALWSKKFGPYPPKQMPLTLQGVTGKFLKVEIFMQAGENKLSPVIKSLSAKGSSVVLP
tara:strand:- start:2948 stop:5065 length:2118 start_codon:yes stop_codon:yes gene_type:complete